MDDMDNMKLKFNKISDSFSFEDLKLVLQKLDIEENLELESVELDKLMGKWICDFGFNSLQISIKKFSDLRYSNFFPALLESYLAQHEMSAPRVSLSILLIKKIPDDLHFKIEEFLSRYNVKHFNWIICDENGKIVGEYKNSKIKTQIKERRDLKNWSYELNQKQALSFSPIQQWLAKVLLLNGIDKGADRGWDSNLWPIKFQESIYDYKILSKISGVSESSCFNFIKLLEERDFLVINRYEYQFRNLESFFSLWKNSVFSERKEELFLVPRKPFGDIDKWRESAPSNFVNYCSNFGNYNVVMGGHLACNAQGLSFSNNKSVLFYVPKIEGEEFEYFLKEMKLRPSSHDECGIRVILQKNEYPILKISKIQNRHFCFADPIQLMFDVEYLGGRGKEQAEYIYEKLLINHFRRWNWLN